MDGISEAGEAPESRKAIHVFICYRRDDSEYQAIFLRNALQAVFGKDQVFLDRGGMRAGSDFVETLIEKVRSSDVVLALIGQRWLIDEKGRRRLDDPEDWVRKEIAEAINSKRRLIPVLLERMSVPTDLPPALRKLSRSNAVELTAVNWEQDVSRLAMEIETRPAPPPPVNGRQPTVTRIKVGREPSAITSAGGNIWVASCADRTVSCIDPQTNDVRVVEMRMRPHALAAGAGALWVYGGRFCRTLVRIDPASRQTSHLRTAWLPLAIAADDHGVWVSYYYPGRVVRMDPAGGIVDTIWLGNEPNLENLRQPWRGLGQWLVSHVGRSTRGRCVVVQEDFVWVVTDGPPETAYKIIVRFDTVTAKVESYRVSGQVNRMVIGDGEIWAADDAHLYRIDLDSTHETMPIAIAPLSFAVVEGSLWVTASHPPGKQASSPDVDGHQPGYLYQIDPARPTEVVQGIPVGREPIAITVALGSVWVANRGDGTVSKVELPRST